jgi:DNA uptake protein ComE-like DNA-binding protein
MAIFISPEGMSYVSQRSDRPDLISNGFRLYLDAIDVESSPVADPQLPESNTGKVDINTASVDEMVAGLGLSIAKAKAIEQHRPYADISELVKAKIDVVTVADKVTI